MFESSFRAPRVWRTLQKHAFQQHLVWALGPLNMFGSFCSKGLPFGCVYTQVRLLPLVPSPNRARPSHMVFASEAQCSMKRFTFAGRPRTNGNLGGYMHRVKSVQMGMGHKQTTRDCRFESLLAFTRGAFWVPIFDPHPNSWKQCRSTLPQRTMEPCISQAQSPRGDALAQTFVRRSLNPTTSLGGLKSG